MKIAPTILAVTAAFTTLAQAADIQWVGNQSDSAVLNGAASFHDGIYWLNYIPPDEDETIIDDTAIFGSGFDPQENQTLPHYLYFGTFQTNYALPSSNPRIPAKDAVINRLEVRTGYWDFDFGTNVNTPGEESADGSLTVEEAIYVGTPLQWGTPDAFPATLTIHNGKLTQSVPGSFSSLVLGEGVNSDGRLIVDGPNSEVELARAAWIGNGGGVGRLELTNGGRFSAVGISTGPYDGPSGEPSTGHVKVVGEGSFVYGLNGLNHGTILIADGASAEAAAGAFVFLGISDGRFAEATVTGMGSTWTITERLTIGGVYHTDTTGHGVLNILDGGLVSCVWGVVGNRSLSRGAVNVAGEGSEWRADVMTLGDDGHGTVRIEHHGRLVTGTSGASIGDTANGVGDVTFEDHSIWENVGSLTIGRFGHGTLKVVEGSTVTSVYGRIGGDPEGVGEVMFSGVDTSWDVDGDLDIGDGGMGTLNVGNNAKITVPTDRVLRLGKQSTGNGALNLASGGTVASGWAEIGMRGVGTAIIEDAGVLAVAHKIVVGQDGTIDLSNEGIVNIGTGDLPAESTLRVGAGGALSGTGTIVGNLLIDGGTVTPGSSPGVLHINGNFHQLPGGLLTMEIGGTTPGTEYDQLLVTGDLLLEGSVQIAFINGFVPQIGDRFDLFTAATAQLTGPLTFLNAPSNFQYSSTFTNGVFSIAVVPEPATWVLMLAGGVLIRHARRRGHLDCAS